ncbi:acetate uptake transporter [Lapillicoccus sp.]|uniref:acetate uptake transporter n=1 Tax=Lapillicoccus sp. TaxID=1909287 RepID=UPI00326364FB
MTAVLDRPAHGPLPAEGVVPDLNDPTAGAVAVSRELASEQVRLIADPAPLGLGAFALTTFLLSLVNAGVLPKDTEPVVLGVALAYGGIAQLLAGMWEFRKGNVFGATAFTSFGAFWLSFWAYLTFFAAGIPAAHHGIAAGWYLLAWAIFTSLMVIAALRTTAVLAGLFAVVVVVFVLLGLGAMTASAGLTTAGGVLGIVAAALAWYLCLAGVAASTFGRPILPNPPLFRR